MNHRYFIKKPVLLVFLAGPSEGFMERLRLDETKAVYIPVGFGSLVEDFPIPLSPEGYLHFSVLGGQLRMKHG